MPPSADLPWRGAEEGARRVVLDLLAEAREALPRVADPADAEGLHDLRVAVRRLRSTLRAWKGPLRGAVRKRDRHALAEIQAHTGKGRDAEVGIAWLERQREKLSPDQRPDLDRLVEELRSERSGRSAGLGGRFAAAFTAWVDDFEPRVARLELSRNLLEEGEEEVFAEALAVRVRSACEDLRSCTAERGGEKDHEGLHAARIACKRLRYLVEPAGGWLEAAEPLVRQCKRLQDLLGGIHDASVMIDRLAAAPRKSASGGLAQARGPRPPTFSPGLLALMERAARRRERLHRRFERDWREGGLRELFRLGDAAARQLTEIARGDVEIERKFLLSGLPPEASTAGEALEIEQGWIPGRRLKERLRRTRAACGRVCHYRTVKLGRGVRRTELEDETSAEVFERLWELTEGRRLRKRRYRLATDQGTWEIDEFLDRELYLAEIELASADQELSLPDWLVPLVLREVTGEKGFSGSELAL